MTAAEIAARGQMAASPPGVTPLEHAQARMVAAGQWSSKQQQGRRWPIGCVALEITQRCNLDCSLCYLSENSEAVKDLPLEEVYGRIDRIFEIYGLNTDVQVTGGDPTLRDHEELVAIVSRIRRKAMRPSLFTNGIKASRALLSRLAEAGLVDVAFHVDLSQRRPGYRSEADLNRLRGEYVERTRGLPLSVLFNTTVFNGNFGQIGDVVSFFVGNSDVVRLASFQLQADVGRSTGGMRLPHITVEAVIDRIQQAANASLTFDGVDAGHPACNRYAMAFVTNGHVYDVFDDKRFITRVMHESAHLQFDRTRPRRALATLLAWAIARPRILLPGVAWVARKLWAMRDDLLAARGKVHKLSFFVHNFMDSCHLERERIDACAFMVATAHGPISMCLHNAKRDSFILEPFRLTGDDVPWNPVVPHLDRVPRKGSFRKKARRGDQ